MNIILLNQKGKPLDGKNPGSNLSLHPVYIYTYIYTYIHIYVYICVYINMYIYIFKISLQIKILSLFHF